MIIEDLYSRALDIIFSRFSNERCKVDKPWMKSKGFVQYNATQLLEMDQDA